MRAISPVLVGTQSTTSTKGGGATTPKCTLYPLAKSSTWPSLRWGLDLRKDFRLHLVGDEEQNDVRPLDCLHDGHGLEPVTSGPLGVVVLDVAYDDLDTGVPQVLGLGVTLAAVAQAGHKPAFDDAQVGVPPRDTAGPSSSPPYPLPLPFSFFQPSVLTHAGSSLRFTQRLPGLCLSVRGPPS